MSNETKAHDLFSIKKQTVGYLLKKKAHLWLLTVQWPLDRQKVPSACTEESIQSLNWLSTGNRRIVECVLERTPATLSSFAWAAQSAGPGRLCDILKDTHRLVCSSLFLFKSNYDEIASPRVTCYLYRVCVPWRIRPSAGVQVHVGHREILTSSIATKGRGSESSVSIDTHSLPHCHSWFQLFSSKIQIFHDSHLGFG